MTIGAGDSGFNAEDRLAVLNILNSYGYYLDTHQMVEWMALFADGARFEGWQGDRLLSSGLEIFTATHDRRARFRNEGTQRRHILSGHRFDTQSATHATGQAYYQLYATTLGKTALVNIGVYEFSMVCENRSWKFETLIVRADSGFD
jgi:hypothetical protein